MPPDNSRQGNKFLTAFGGKHDEKTGKSVSYVNVILVNIMYYDSQRKGKAHIGGSSWRTNRRNLVYVLQSHVLM